MAHRRGHVPSTLSGGEQQRVAIARALVMRPALLLADEPTGNLDSANGRQVTALLRRLATQEEQTIVMVTHDSNVAAQADRLVRRAGRLGGDRVGGGGVVAACGCRFGPLVLVQGDNLKRNRSQGTVPIFAAQGTLRCNSA